LLSLLRHLPPEQREVVSLKVYEEMTFAEIAAIDLSLARLVEGHADAVAILAEGALDLVRPHAALGVWAANPAAVAASPTQRGWMLRGTKPWCSGASSLDHALVTASTPDGVRLFLVDLDAPGIVPDPTSWPTIGMEGSDTLDVAMNLTVDKTAAICSPGWYTDRPGFWFGSVGVAACWLGGAIGAVRAVAATLRSFHPDSHQLAALGAAAARCEVLAAAVERTARWIDIHPADPTRHARSLALGIRQAAEEDCLAVITDVGRAGGARPMTHDTDQARRLVDLPVFVRQHHGGRDAATYACALLEGGLGTS